MQLQFKKRFWYSRVREKQLVNFCKHKKTSVEEFKILSKHVVSRISGSGDVDGQNRLGRLFSQGGQRSRSLIQFSQGGQRSGDKQGFWLELVTEIF
ncbi:hypothetical protein L596_018455 [Steinernema carpocapsae]|uniref:Uncharacterized protein n=1 Tax=Steinernema carpocapsae TaxID=34508 RepID=A0A4U5N4Y6_STECR|nr:hypothetical protein L596_018455 [Steinernema carpocapsae]